MRAILLVPFLCSLLAGQVTGRFSPGPLDQFAAVGLWYCSICNDYTVAVVIAPERVSMVAGSLRLLRPAQAQQLMIVKRGQNKKFVASEIIEYGLIGAGVIGGSGLFSITPKILASLAAGTGVAHQLQDKWRSEIPTLPTFDGDLFAGPISLASGDCTTRQVYALKMAAAKVVPSAPFTILVPQAAVQSPLLVPQVQRPSALEEAPRAPRVVALVAGVPFEVHYVSVEFWRGIPQ